MSAYRGFLNGIGRKSEFAHFMEAFKQFGVFGAFRKYYVNNGLLKFGEFMGEDESGNRYYENMDYPYGQHRWVEYRCQREDPYPACFHFDASMVPAGWHAWLHHVCDETPYTAKPGGFHVDFNVAGHHAFAIEGTVKGSNNPYTHNLGKVQTPFEMNMTQHKARGFGVGSGYSFSGPYVDNSWKQVGNPLHPKYSPSTEKVTAWNPVGSAKPKRGEKEVEYKPSPHNPRVEGHGHYVPHAHKTSGNPQIPNVKADE